MVHDQSYHSHHPYLHNPITTLLEVYALQGVQSGNSIPMFQNKTIYPIFKSQEVDKGLGQKFHCTLFKIPEVHRSNLHCSRSLKL
jgi:hypothetical protein